MTTETIQVAGVRCERCVMRLGEALQGHAGLEAANANLMGEVTLTWDESQTSRDQLVTVLTGAGFAPLTRRQSPPSPLPRPPALAADECGLWLGARDPEAGQHSLKGH